MRVVLLLVLLAGCAEAVEPAGDLDDVPAMVDEDRGAIRGIVVDPSLVPVQLATVSIASGERVTGENGTFRFSRVDPGAYRIDVAAEGFIPTTVNAAVEVGVIAEIRVQLEPDTSMQPYHENYPFRGLIEASAGPATSVLWDVVAATGSDPCRCSMEVQIEGAAALVVEAFWDDQIYTNNIRHTEFTATVSSDGGIISSTQSNPLHWYIAADELGTDMHEVSLHPDETIPTVQQEFTLIVSAFYIEAPDANWRFAVDG